MGEKARRKVYGAELKAKIGLEAVRGIKTINEIAQDFCVHPVSVITEFDGLMITAQV